MRGTVYDFSFNLVNTDITKDLKDSILICIEFDFKTNIVTDRKDLSIVSNIRLRGNEEIQYGSVEEYCELQPCPVSQRVYSGYFGYFSIFDFDFRDSVEYAPEFLIRETTEASQYPYINILKMKGLEYYGFLSNVTIFILRGSMYPDLLKDVSLLELTFVNSSLCNTGFSTDKEKDIRYPVLSQDSIRMLPSPGTFLGDNTYRRIISTSSGDSIFKYSEKNETTLDLSFSFCTVSIRVFSVELYESTCKFLSGTYTLRTQYDVTLNDVFFGIILHKPKNIIYDFISDEIPIIFLTQE